MDHQSNHQIDPNEITQNSQLDSEEGEHQNQNHTTMQPIPAAAATLDRPTLGMIFQSETQAYDYYNAYAKSSGFSVRRSKMVARKDKTLTRRLFCCSKEGFRSKHPRGDPMRPRPVTRTGCRARLGIHLKAGNYTVNEFVGEHNHPLARPSETHMLRSQRKNQDPQAFCIDDILAYLGEEGAPPHDLNLAEGDSTVYLQKWCSQILNKAQEDKKKIRELTAELQRERRQSAKYKEQLELVLKEMDDHTNHLSNQVENIVYNIYEGYLSKQGSSPSLGLSWLEDNTKSSVSKTLHNTKSPLRSQEHGHSNQNFKTLRRH